MYMYSKEMTFVVKCSEEMTPFIFLPFLTHWREEEKR